jgi:phenylpropionate dioxygenase-like ring-hydroxylating dioxygenase large terminal subunit
MPDFNLLQHWYPVTPMADLQPEYPTSVSVLAVKMAIWKPRNAETYRVFLDSCPHRLAPLSEGRVDEHSGHLIDLLQISSPKLSEPIQSSMPLK